MWGIRYGRWWAVQWVLDGWLSLGVHVDLKTRVTNDDTRYGPYMDLHLGCVIVSVGRNPAYSGELERALGISRGGVTGGGSA